MITYGSEEYKLMKEKEKELAKKYPTEAAYNSKASLWGCGLRDGIISQSLFDAAKVYYGSLWTYTGD